MNKSKLIFILVLIGLVSFALYAQTMVWACSNHNPAHVASTQAQMQQLTAAHQCTGWHSL